MSSTDKNSVSEELAATFMRAGSEALRDQIARRFPALDQDGCDTIVRMVKALHAPEKNAAEIYQGKGFVP